MSNFSFSHSVFKGHILQTRKKPGLVWERVNRSLSEFICPNRWKTANVILIFKKDDKSSLTNYRPVSLLSCCGKLLERLIFKHMYNCFLDNNLNKYQSGFLPKHSTTFQLVDIFHHVCQSFDNKQFSCMVFCDISKAFDRVWHKGLLFKLEQNGIEGNLPWWLSIYLSKRKVVLQSATSSHKPRTASVPQGSVLGSLLFLIYVNDITLSLTRIFADDSPFYYSASSIRDIEGIINHDLNLISSWAKQWLVTFNPNKTEAILFFFFFFLKPYDQLPNLKSQNTNVTFVENHKHLGLTISRNGQWNAHVENTLKSASYVLGIVRKLRFKVNRKSLNTSCLAPIVEYFSIVWDGCSDACAESLQKKTRLPELSLVSIAVSLENLFVECGWQTLKDRCQVQKMFSCIKPRDKWFRNILLT